MFDVESFSSVDGWMKLHKSKPLSFCVREAAVHFLCTHEVTRIVDESACVWKVYPFDDDSEDEEYKMEVLQ